MSVSALSVIYGDPFRDTRCPYIPEAFAKLQHPVASHIRPIIARDALQRGLEMSSSLRDDVELCATVFLSVS